MTPQEALAEALRDEAASVLYKLAELGFKIVPMTGLERRMQSGGPGIVETTPERPLTPREEEGVERALRLSELVDSITDENRHEETGVTPMGSTRWR